MSNREMEHLHAIQLMLAEELKRVCEQNGLQYFMLAGTMLGAVRHKGFVPWDDDMDFGMLRSDFDRLVEVFPKQTDGSRFFLQTDRTEKGFAYNYAKIRLLGTSVKESFSEDVSVTDGIYIDIFPVDRVADNPLKAILQIRGFWLARNILWIKCGYGDKQRRKTLVYRLVSALSVAFPFSFLVKWKYALISRYQNEDTKRVIVSDGTYGLKKETFDAICISELKMFPFEDTEFPGMVHYEPYLKHYYGDYMQIPPENERDHHGRLSVDFGDY